MTLKWVSLYPGRLAALRIIVYLVWEAVHIEQFVINPFQHGIGLFCFKCELAADGQTDINSFLRGQPLDVSSQTVGHTNQFSSAISDFFQLQKLLICKKAREQHAEMLLHMLYPGEWWFASNPYGSVISLLAYSDFAYRTSGGF